MEEIVEVLTQEIAGFNNSIGKLEELSEKFDTLKIQTDTTILESRLDDFVISQKRTVKSYENRMEEVLKNTREI